MAGYKKISVGNKKSVIFAKPKFNKQMQHLKYILLFLLFVIMVFIGYLYISAHSEEERTYYFPQIDVYMKVYKPIFRDYGYVTFCKDSIFSFSENSDFIRIYKSEISTVNFIFNPMDNKNIYVIDRWNNTKINQVNFDIKKIDKKDTTFFEQEFIAGIKTQILKSQYFEIFIEGYLQSVFYVDYNISESPLRANPISSD